MSSVNNNNAASAAAVSSSHQSLGKRARDSDEALSSSSSSLHSAATSRVDLTSAMEEEEKSNPASSSPVNSAMSSVRAPAASPTAASSASVLMVPNTSNYIPVYVGRDKLETVARINNSRDNALSLKLRVDSRYPSSPKIDSLHGRYNSQSKYRLAAALLGGASGFGINVPVIPLSLCVRQTAELLAGQQYTAVQRAWLAELSRQVRIHGTLMRGIDGTAEAKAAACGELWTHLGQLRPQNGSMQHALWESSQLTSDWCQVLAPNSCIQGSDSSRPHSKDPTTAPSHHYYQLALHAATPEAAYVIACVMFSYSTMPMLHRANAQAFSKLLADYSAAVKGSADGSDSSVAAASDGWQVQSSRRHSADRVMQRASMALKTQLTAFATSADMVAADCAYKTHTRLPLLALATTVSMRPITRPYISCIIDNFQSAGCNIHDLGNDKIFQTIVNSRPEFAFPNAYWTVNQRIGNGTASVWIREEYKDLLADLNAHLRINLCLPEAFLRVACTVVKRDRRGRLDFNSAIKVFLTPATKVGPPPFQGRPAVSEQLSAPTTTVPASSWAARMAEGIKRVADNAALNHHPRKSQRSVDQVQPVRLQAVATTASGAAAVSAGAINIAAPTNNTLQHRPEHQLPSAQPAHKTSGLGARAQMDLYRAEAGLLHDPYRDNDEDWSGKDPSALLRHGGQLNNRLEEFELEIMEAIETRVAALVDERLAACVERIEQSVIKTVTALLGPMLDKVLGPMLDRMTARIEGQVRASVAPVVGTSQGRQSGTAEPMCTEEHRDARECSNNSPHSSASAGPALNGSATSHGY